MRAFELYVSCEPSVLSRLAPRSQFWRAQLDGREGGLRAGESLFFLEETAKQRLAGDKMIQYS